MCGARPTCFMMFCAMRRRLCLVRVHPELTNVFFLLVSCCIERRTSCGGCTMRLRQTTCMRHLQPSCRTEQRLRRRRRRRRLVCVALDHVMDVQRQHRVAARVAALAALLSVFQPPRRREPRSIKPVAATTSSLFRETGTHLKCWWYSSPWKIQVTTF